MSSKTKYEKILNLAFEAEAKEVAISEYNHLLSCLPNITHEQIAYLEMRRNYFENKLMEDSISIRKLSPTGVLIYDKQT